MGTQPTKPKEKLMYVTFTIIVTRSDPIITLCPSFKFYDHTNKTGTNQPINQLKSIRPSREEKKQVDHEETINCRK